jgi:hypothetical protein
MLLLTKSAIANPTTEASISQTQPFPLIVINSKTALSVMSLGLESLFSFTIFLSTCICGMSCGFASRNIIHTKNSANYIFLEIINYILLENNASNWPNDLAPETYSAFSVFNFAAVWYWVYSGQVCGLSVPGSFEK